MLEESSRGCLIAVTLFVGVLALFTHPIGTGDRASSRFQAESDESAIRFFHDNARGFEKLRELIEKHPDLVYYHHSRNETWPALALENPENDLPEVRRFMSELGISALNGSASSWGVRLIIHSEGWVTASTTRSFYFSRKAPTPIVPSIENYVITEPESAGVFRSIAENWYLKMDWGG